jgi:hypothetical protein
MKALDRNSKPANNRTVLVLDGDVLVRMPGANCQSAMAEIASNVPAHCGCSPSRCGPHPARLTLTLTMSGRARQLAVSAVAAFLTSVPAYPDPSPSLTSAVYLACLVFFLAFLLLARRERL